MEKSRGRIAGVIIKIAVALILGAAFCVLAFYFSDSALVSVFAEGTTIDGVDVSGLTADEAEAAVTEEIENYSLDITVTSEGVSDDADETAQETGSETETAAEETETETETETEAETETASDEEADEESSENGVTSVKYTIAGSDISLAAAYEELVFENLLEEQKEAESLLESGGRLDDTMLALSAGLTLSYDSEALSSIIEEFTAQFESEDEAADASLVYDEDEGAFVIVPETYGGGLETEDLLTLAMEAVNTLSENLDLSYLIDVPAITSEDPDLLSALATANAYLAVELTYTFSATGKSVTISKDTILSWLYYDDETVSINIDTEALSSYADTLASNNSVYTSTSKFKTTSGSYISVNVSSSGETVDSDSLYYDIYDNITSFTSGTFAAAYTSTSVSDDGDGIVDFGGTYVEIDLSNQKLYLYVNGTCTLTTSIVSGSVNAGHRTPTGVYTIKSKQTNRYLTGVGYRSWVYYWMPFNGGIGLHDATWRSSFGGSIYLYNGSHGCINMPYSAAKQVYNSVSVGTYVILYGGATSVDMLTQKVSVTSSFTKYETDSSFSLGATTNGDGDLSYSSSDTSVVTVDSNGKVTIVGPGTATITVTASATTEYTSATATTTITVNHNYKYTSATWGSNNSSCKIKVTCAGCGSTKTLDATVTSAVTKAATTTSTGTKTYTATATYNGQTFTATTTETIAKLEETTTSESTEETTTAEETKAAETTP